MSDTGNQPLPDPNPNQPEETNNDEEFRPSVGSSSSARLSGGVGNSSMMSSKSINPKTSNYSVPSIDFRGMAPSNSSVLNPSRSLASQKSSLAAMNRFPDSVPDVDFRIGLMGRMKESMKKIAGSFGSSKPKREFPSSSSFVISTKRPENVSASNVPGSSASVNKLADSVKSIQLSSNNNADKAPSSVRKVKKAKRDGRPSSRSSVSSTSPGVEWDSSRVTVHFDHVPTYNPMNTLTKSFKSMNIKRKNQDTEPSGSSRKVKKLVKLDKDGKPMNPSVCSSSSFANRSRNVPTSSVER